MPITYKSPRTGLQSAPVDEADTGRRQTLEAAGWTPVRPAAGPTPHERLAELRRQAHPILADFLRRQDGSATLTEMADELAHRAPGLPEALAAAERMAAAASAQQRVHARQDAMRHAIATVHREIAEQQRQATHRRRGGA